MRYHNEGGRPGCLLTHLEKHNILASKKIERLVDGKWNPEKVNVIIDDQIYRAET